MTFESKQEKIKQLFAPCKTPEERYKKIIEFGSVLPPLAPLFKTEENRVHGCQSAMYLHTEYKDGLMIFSADSDALISKGLAALLISVYSYQTAATVLKQPPIFLAEIGIPQSLSPSRSNGLSSLFLRMQQEAIKFFSRSI
jgi:cysteine desulfuration protein SufE